MSAVGSHLVRRGVEAVTYMDEKKVKIELPSWAIVMFGLTIFAFLVVDVMVEYIFGRVVPALIMIESLQDNVAFEPLPTEDFDSTIAKDPEHVNRPTAQYISASSRRSYQLLKAEGGRLRGFAIFFVQKMAVAFVATTMGKTVGFLPTEVYVVLASVLCAQLSLGWTLIVISKPSPQYWFRRIPSIKMWKKVAIPTALHAAVSQIAIAVPLYLFVALGLEEKPNTIVNMPAREQRMNAIMSLGVMGLGLLLSVFLVLPATVALTRVQASLLSDTEETIVPFDRTFGGKVVPEIVGGSGMIGILDAWTTFDWAARVRLIKAYGKVFVMVCALCVLFSTVILVQCLVSLDIHKVIVPIVEGSN